MKTKHKSLNNGNLLVSYVDDKMVVTAIGHPTYTFRIVDSVPYPYTLWDIGYRMPDGYLPLCQLAPSQGSPNGDSIDGDHLLAIKAEGAESIMKAVRYGFSTPDEMEAYIQKNQGAKEGTDVYNRAKCVKKALHYMQQIKWY